MPIPEKEQIIALFQTLSSLDFAEWYASEFTAYMAVSDTAPTGDEISDRIAFLFGDIINSSTEEQ